MHPVLIPTDARVTPEDGVFHIRPYPVDVAPKDVAIAKAGPGPRKVKSEKARAKAKKRKKIAKKSRRRNRR